MTPDGKTFDPETVTDKQLVQYEQAIDRGLTEADAMRLTEHEYNGFQANAIIAAALNPAVGEDVLDALATPKYTAAQMTAIAKIAIRGGDFARFLDPEAGRRLSMISGTVSLRAATTFPWRATTAHPAGTRSRRMRLQWMRPERMTRTSNRTRSDKKQKDRMPHPIWERHLHKCEKEREVRMMKAEKGSEIITTICEYENSVAMPDNERLTYLDTCGIARLKDGNGNVKAQEAYASRCSEYLRFGHEVDLAACGVYSPYDALKVCDTPEIFLKTGFEQRPMLYTQKHLFQALTPKSDYNPHRHGFSIEQVKRFPELLAFPVVLANSPTRDDVLLAILLATDAYDTPLIAGIKPDGTGNYGEREVETNMVLSVYSRQNFIRYFALLRDMDAFVFVSGRKIEALEDLSGLPLAGNCSGLDIDRILQRPKCLG